MDEIFKFTHFGIVSRIHDDFFIQEGKEHKPRSLEKLKYHLQTVFTNKKRKYLILFPEGGFLRKRKLSSQNFARKNALPVLEHCTLPRMGALNSVIEALNIDQQAKRIEVVQGNSTEMPCFVLNKVVDVTIAYLDGNPLSLVDISFGLEKVSEVHVNYKVYDIHQLPTDLKGLEQWMYNIYSEKEKLLDDFYRTGKFSTSGEAKNSNELLFDPLRFIFINLFFVVSMYIFYQLWYTTFFYVLIT